MSDPSEQNDKDAEREISLNISQIEHLLDTGVFDAKILMPFREPVFLSLVVKLNDVLQKLSDIGHRVSFSDDIAEGDITTLINKVRNAACHVSSSENMLDTERRLRFVFNMVHGKGSMLSIDGKPATSNEYEDDVAIFYGQYRLYFNRHFLRALEEAKDATKKKYPHSRFF